MPSIKISRVMIERTPGFSRPRWFLDLIDDQHSCHPIGNADSAEELRELRERVVVVGQSWTLKPLE